MLEQLACANRPDMVDHIESDQRFAWVHPRNVKCSSKFQKRKNLALPTKRPTNHFDDFRRLAGAQNADTKDFAGHPEGDGSGAKQQKVVDRKSTRLNSSHT